MEENFEKKLFEGLNSLGDSTLSNKFIEKIKEFTEEECLVNGLILGKKEKIKVVLITPTRLINFNENEGNPKIDIYFLKNINQISFNENNDYDEMSLWFLENRCLRIFTKKHYHQRLMIFLSAVYENLPFQGFPLKPKIVEEDNESLYNGDGDVGFKPDKENKPD